MATTQRGNCWSCTINNPTQADEECIALARQKGWTVEGQKEKGKEGTPHYQLMLRTPQVRFSAVKKMFPRGHIELARNPAALASYVIKEETREGSLPKSQEMYPSLSKLWELIYDKISEDREYPADDLDWSRMSDKEKLDLFDKACYQLIYDGYHIETIAVNNLTRASFAKFAGAIMKRAFGDRQTDRHALDSQDVSIPELTNAPHEVSSSDNSPSYDSSHAPPPPQHRSRTEIQ